MILSLSVSLFFYIIIKVQEVSFQVDIQNPEDRAKKHELNIEFKMSAHYAAAVRFMCSVVNLDFCLVGTFRKGEVDRRTFCSLFDGIMPLFTSNKKDSAAVNEDMEMEEEEEEEEGYDEAGVVGDENVGEDEDEDEDESATGVEGSMFDLISSCMERFTPLDLKWATKIDRRGDPTPVCMNSLLFKLINLNT